ncbi:uncharacterized protein DNG_08434 [Cephalotrichum gorgonifer]|uniref:Uncharacterized protein n=1 Tax=Cephalotrichum gorgonifer TaxID=2041049 RepID=A0AAE8SZ66_9PEZI|nr:uncharacterized protein DNG_08434 [Cephalotrichum gorgonifer]
MEAPIKLGATVPHGKAAGYASSGRSSSETASSGSVSSPTSTTGTSIREQSLPSNGIHSPQVIASPVAFVTIGELQYASGEIRAMADIVAQARNASELPPTQSSPLDAQVIIEDYTLLSRLRLARGDPALPPPKEYTNLRVEAARRIRERDAGLENEECRREASKRVESYLRVVGQEKRFYELAREMSKGKGEGRDMEGIADEIMAVVEREIGTTAESLDLAVGELDSTTSTLDTTASALDRLFGAVGDTANIMDTTASGLTYTATTLDATATTLNATASVLTSQISALTAQLYVLTDLWRSQRLSPTQGAPATSATRPDARHDIHQAVNLTLEDVVRGEVTRALRQAMNHTQEPYPPRNSDSSITRHSPSWTTAMRTGDSFLDSASGDILDTANTNLREVKERRTNEESNAQEKRCRRVRKYARAVISRILGQPGSLYSSRRVGRVF